MHSLDSFTEHLLCAGRLGWDGEGDIMQIESRRRGLELG